MRGWGRCVCVCVCVGGGDGRREEEQSREPSGWEIVLQTGGKCHLVSPGPVATGDVVEPRFDLPSTT